MKIVAPMKQSIDDKCRRNINGERRSYNPIRSKVEKQLPNMLDHVIRLLEAELERCVNLVGGAEALVSLPKLAAARTLEIDLKKFKDAIKIGFHLEDDLDWLAEDIILTILFELEEAKLICKFTEKRGGTFPNVVFL